MREPSDGRRGPVAFPIASTWRVQGADRDGGERGGERAGHGRPGNPGAGPRRWRRPHHEPAGHLLRHLPLPAGDHAHRSRLQPAAGRTAYDSIPYKTLPIRGVDRGHGADHLRHRSARRASPGELDPEPARASEAATDPLRAVADGGGESGLDAQVVGGSPSAVRALVGILVPEHPPLGERWDATPGRRTASRNACIGAIEEPGGGGDRRAGDRGEVGGRGGRDAAGAWSARGPMRRSTPCADRWDGSIRCASRRRAPGSAPAPRAVAGARAAGPRGVRSGRRTRPASRAPGAGAGSLRQDRPSGPGGLPGTVRTKVHRSPAARRPPPTQRRRVREGPARCRRRAIRPAFRGPGRPAPAPGPGWPRRARR
jgi:hypothetical protein